MSELNQEQMLLQTPVGQELMSKEKEELVRIISATREDEEWFRNRANELTAQVETQAAAIASAEARARLEEHVRCCDVCMMACMYVKAIERYCDRGRELEAAACTPDSTKEPE